MSFNWEEISKEWLLGESTAYTPGECVRAFNIVKEEMRDEWFQAFTEGGRGVGVAFPLIELGLCLEEILKLPHTNRLLQRLQRLKDADFDSAVTEARLIAHYARAELPIEVEPELAVDNAVRRPDFRVLAGGVWVYVEVSRARQAKPIKELYEVMQWLGDRVSELPCPYPFRVEVALRKDQLDDSTSAKIIRAVKALLATKLIPEKVMIEDIATVLVRPHNEARLTLETAAPSDMVEIFSECMHRKVGDESQSRSVRIKAAVSDDRARRILAEEARQLSRQAPGIIVLDVSRVPGGMGWWPGLIKRSFQPELHRRVSAVLLLHTFLGHQRQEPSGFTRMETKGMLLENPHALNELPPQFLEATSALIGQPPFFL
jgi:hypothetical protein